MNDFKVYYNNIEITEWLTVINVNRGIGSEVTNELLKIGISSGKYLKGRTEDEKIIKMSFFIQENLIEKRENLAHALYSKETVRLIFNDEPDKYYLAVTDGAVITDEEEGMIKGVINWLVPEGVAYSVEEKSVELTAASLKVDYKGTAEAYPRFEVVNHSDNGFFGVINQDGEKIQVGNPDDVDEVPYKQNETVIHEPFTKESSAWVVNKGVVTYPNLFFDPTRPNDMSGTFDWITDYHTVIPVYPNGTKDIWYGAKMNRLVPKNSEGKNNQNFIRKTRIDFGQVRGTQRGRMEIVVQSNEEILCAVVIRDSKAQLSNTTLEFWVNGDLKKTVTLNLNVFKEPFHEATMSREGDSISFKFSNIAKMVGGVIESNNADVFFNWSSNDVLAKPVTSITVAGMRYKRTDTIDMRFTDDLFTWVNVDKMQDIPNLFADEDILHIDNKTRLISRNGVVNLSIGALGNEYFTLKPEANEILTLWSEWAKKPTIRMYYQERWK